MSAPARAPAVDGLGRTVPGWVLRAALVAVGLLLLVTVLAGRAAGPLDAGVAVVALVLAALAPGGPLPAVFLVLVALGQLVGGAPADLAWRVPVAAALVHAVHVLAALAAGVPVRARLETAALGPPARRWALAQVTALPVVVAVALLVAGRPAAGSAAPWLLGAALVVVALALVPVLRARPPRP